MVKSVEQQRGQITSFLMQLTGELAAVLHSGAALDLRWIYTVFAALKPPNRILEYYLR